jgi:hypothetical protein
MKKSISLWTKDSYGKQKLQQVSSAAKDKLQKYYMPQWIQAIVEDLKIWNWSNLVKNIRNFSKMPNWNFSQL